MTAHRNSGTGAPTRWSCSHNAPASPPATATTATAYRTIAGGEEYQAGFELLMRRCLAPRRYAADAGTMPVPSGEAAPRSLAQAIKCSYLICLIGDPG